MGKLDELREKIYSKAFPGRKRTVRVPLADEALPENALWQKSSGELQMETLTKKRHKAFAVVIGVLLGLSAVFWIAYQILQSGLFFYFLGKSEVELSIIAPERVDAGDKIIYSVVYKNKSRAIVTGGELAFEYPKGAEPVGEIGERTSEGAFRVKVLIPAIASGEEGHTDFAMRIFGKEGNAIQVSATLVFTPENASSKFTVRKDFLTLIERVPVAVSFLGGTKARSGDAYEFKIEYASNASADFRDVAIRVLYPDGFQYRESDRVPDVRDSKEMVWQLGLIQPGSSGSIRVLGIVTGMTLEPKTFQYQLGTYDKNTKAWFPYIDHAAVAEIIEQPLGVLVYINGSREGSASFGDTLRAEVKIRNNSAVSLHGITVETAIEGPVDFAKINANTGAIVGSRTVRWTQVTDPALAELNPNEERVFPFSVSARGIESAGRFKDATITFKTSIKADVEVGVDFNPEGNDTLIVALNAVPSFQAKTLYSGSLIRNTGPIPPKIGARTSYTVIWEIDSLGGDLAEVRMSGFLPPYVRWENVIIPDSERIAYQKSTGEIIWNPGTIRAGGETRRIMFQVAIVPSESDENKTLALITKMKGSASDAFTNKEIQVTVRDVTTDIRDDFGVPLSSGSVRK